VSEFAALGPAGALDAMNRPDFLDTFERAARAAAATVERLPRATDLCEQSEALARAVLRVAPDARRVAIAPPADLAPELFSSCERLPGVFSGRGKSELAAADVGITDAFAGVARTGSVCIALDPDHTGFISLLARMHVAVVAAEDIVEAPRELFRRDRLGGKGLDRNFVFVTGPSATADMGPLVRGVHGPHRLHIIVLT
jgi:L-lactate dehydrogenase complex protein LldG